MSEEFDEFEELSSDLDSDIREIKEKSVKSPNPSSKVYVYFQSTIGPGNKQEKMKITLDAPVSDLKYTIGQIFNLPSDEFHLSHAGRTLDPDDILSNYDIEDEDTLLLIPISTAGSY